MSAWRAAAAIVVLACGGGAAGERPSSALTTARRDELIAVGAHNEVRLVSAGERLVFAASPHGVIIYDALFRGWLPPLTLDDGFRRSPTALAADPTEDAVWVGTTGRVIYYRPRMDYAITATLSGTPEEIYFDRRNLSAGAYVRAGGSIVRVSRTGGVSMGALVPAEAQLRSPTTREVIQRYPSLETFLPLLTRGDDMEQWRASAATLTPGRSEVWLGTSGNGLFRVDPGFNRAEHLPFGLLDPSVNSLALAGDGVWIGGSGTPGERDGLVFASDDLQRWRWVTGPPSRPLANARVNAIALRDRTAWLATTRGLLRMNVDADDVVSRWDLADGLPSDAITSVVATTEGAWVGTSAGLARVDQAARSVGPRIGVRDLLLWGDTLWIASDAGLLAMAPPDSSPRRVAVDDARLSRAVRAIARSDTVLAAVTETDLIEIDITRHRVLPPRATNASAIGGAARIAMDGQSIWVAGDAGVVAIHRASGRSSVLSVGVVLPAAATSVVLARGIAWIGTRNGLVRVRRRSDGMPP